MFTPLYSVRSQPWVGKHKGLPPNGISEGPFPTVTKVAFVDLVLMTSALLL